MEIIGIPVPIWVVVSSVVVLLYTIMMSRDFLTFRRMGIPGPTPLPILGNLVGILWQGFRAYDKNAIRKYGKVFGDFDRLRPNLVVADKDMLREILVKQFSNFPNRRVFDDFNGDMEYSIMHTKGNQWKHGRSMISPTFSTGNIRKMVPMITEACDILVRTCKNKMKTGDDGQMEMRRLFGGYTMDVISSTAFGIHVDSQSNPDDLFVTYAKKMLDVSFVSPQLFLIMFLPALKPLLLKLGVGIFPQDSMAFFRKLITQLLEGRRRNKEAGRTDFLQLMVDAQDSRHYMEDGNNGSTDRKKTCSKDKSLTIDEIMGNAEILFAAGYETTSVTLTMNAYNLALNQECQERLRQEIAENIGSDAIDYDNVQKLQYLDMCVSETLRMYPPALRIDRDCVKTTKVKDITIPAGMSVSIPVYAMHHDPEIWEKPDDFDPNRFSASEKAKLDPLDYIPFGYGPRNCIGRRLALLEAKMATAYLVRNFRLCVGSKTDIPPKLEDIGIFRPSYLWLKLEEIK